MEVFTLPDPQIPEFYANVPISTPTCVPEAEDIPMNGFAFSADFGLIISLADDGNDAVDTLFNLRQPLDDRAIDFDSQDITGVTNG